MGSPAEPVTGVPVALTIAGSDSGGGAGIQADLKVFMALGCHGTSALTALTAQNTVGVNGVFGVTPEFVRVQIEAVAQDLPLAAAKTGMLASADIAHAVAAAVRDFAIPNLVVDPVFVSKHGSRLLEEDSVAALREDLFPLATLITPNLHEAGALAGFSLKSLDDMKEAARALHGFGPGAVLVKGGHLGERLDMDDEIEGAEESAVDVLYDGNRMLEIGGPRYDTEDTHGTGCALAAAVAAHLARGAEVEPAVRAAKAFVAGAIRRSLRLGGGYGPVNPAWELWERG